MLRFILAIVLAAGALAATGAVHAQQRNLGIAAVQLQVPGESPIQLYGESHALVIGASAYSRGWPRLGGVPGDVRAVSAALKDQGFRVSELLNPTLAQLDGGMRKFISEHGQNPGNRLLIYFAGHGHTLKSAAGGDLGYIVPVDAPLPNERNLGAFKAAAMSMEVIESFAKEIDAKHALFLFDSCFSGTFFKMRAAPESISLKTAQPVRQFITAGSAEQRVPDVSVFRQQFIAGIRGEADLNGDGYVTGSELGMFLEDKVTNYSRRTQTPQYGKIRDPNLDKGDFVFSLPGRASRPVAAAPAAAIDPLAVELSFWDSVKDSRSADELRAYLSSYPSGRFAELARARMRSLEVSGPAAAPTQLAVAPPSVQTLAPTAVADDLQRLAAGTVFRDCADCPEMVVIPPGRFAMGSPDSEPGRIGSEGPMHTVAIPAVFGVGKFEVTKGQFARFVSESGYSAGGGCVAWTGSKFEQDASKDWRNPGFPQTDNDPVVCVNWNDAKAYAQWLTQKSGKAYRLLTEAEWEYAARAGGQESRPWGDNPNDACRYANVADASAKRVVPGTGSLPFHECNDGRAYTAPVGSYQPNGFGLHDMIGNAWEWTEDCWNDKYAGAPTDGSAWASGECRQRVLRGGSWGLGPRFARSAVRYRGGTSYRDFSLGFRLARTN